MSASEIFRLTIKRFRGIENFDWYPAKGLNVLLGGGDVGKSTILEAIALLLGPAHSAALADSDYFGRNVESGFTIGAVISFSSCSEINKQVKQNWPWLWHRGRLVAPGTESETDESAEPVYLVQATGTPELDLIHEIIQPDDQRDAFSVALRRSIGLVRLTGDEKGDRDLRLVQGSALDRLVSDKLLRSRLAQGFAQQKVSDKLLGQSAAALQRLDAAFKKSGLPTDLDLSVTGGGFSIAALIGLTAGQAGTSLALSSWGSGTRRLAALEVSAQKQGENPMMLIDEAERGLEPYRQRALISKLEGQKSQVFMTTHSPTVVAASSEASFWHIDATGSPGKLDAKSTKRHLQADPEAFLSRLTIVGEGVTEVGFVRYILTDRYSIDAIHGVHVTDGGGNENSLNLLEALAEAHIAFGAFVDNEDGKFSGRWDAIRTVGGDLTFRWESGSLEENVLALVSEGSALELLDHVDQHTKSARLRTLAERLGLPSTDFQSISIAAGGNLMQTIIGAATGSVPPGKGTQAKEFKAHSRCWFKSLEGGRELAQKVVSLEIWGSLEPTLSPFFSAVRAVVFS